MSNTEKRSTQCMTVSFRIPDDLDKALKTRARVTGFTQTGVILAALRKELGVEG